MASLRGRLWTAGRSLYCARRLVASPHRVFYCLPDYTRFLRMADTYALEEHSSGCGYHSGE